MSLVWFGRVVSCSGVCPNVASLRSRVIGMDTGYSICQSLEVSGTVFYPLAAVASHYSTKQHKTENRKQKIENKIKIKLNK